MSPENVFTKARFCRFGGFTAGYLPKMLGYGEWFASKPGFETSAFKCVDIHCCQNSTGSPQYAKGKVCRHVYCSTNSYTYKLCITHNESYNRSRHVSMSINIILRRVILEH
jgi:hypothetical protein